MPPELPQGFKFIEPADAETIKKYYQVRYATLRKPWGQPLGSEFDPTDDVSTHVLLLDHETAVAVCRLHFNSDTEAQIRYMGVDETYRNKGYGGMIIKHIEKLAFEKGAKRVILQSRETAIPFYEKQGYAVIEKSYLLFNSIQHFLMEKYL